MTVLKSLEPDIDIPQLDLLTLLFGIRASTLTRASTPGLISGLNRFGMERREGGHSTAC